MSSRDPLDHGVAEDPDHVDDEPGAVDLSPGGDVYRNP
jgi:hypothetical protein